jgi:alpha-ketoglutarate-dependent taurine dioxygenase
MTTSMTLERFPAVGAEIHGVTKDALANDPDLPAHLMDALEQHGVLVLRDLHLDDATQVRFCQRLGDVVVSGSDKTPGIFIVSLDPDRATAYLRGTFNWHIDGATVAAPPVKLTVLTAHVLASQGGQTMFASTYAAYDDLSDDEKAMADELRVVHSVEASRRLVFAHPTAEQEAEWSRMPRVVHPLVWRHRSGRRSLVLGSTALEVVGMDRDEGRALLDELLDRATRPERVYRHEWAMGDTVIWDNRGVLHRVEPYDESSPREMHRTTVAGDELIA